MNNSKTKNFRADENTLWILINNQAQTIEKAILETVMNSIDANSTKVNIDISADKIVVQDNGHGFLSREDIQNHFSRIGTPHVEGDAKFGRFRMGRTQVFKYGRNTWRSNTFQMIVDIKEWGKSHEITSDLKQQDGCTITIDLYEHMTVHEQTALRRTIRHWVRWSDVPIYVNGQKISDNPATQGSDYWTEETANAWFELNDEDTLSLYNMGILVADFSSEKFGVGGIVVSKNNLDLTYARNSVQSKCPEYRSIQKTLKKYALENINKNDNNQQELKWIADEILSGDIEITQKQIITKVKIISSALRNKIPLIEMAKVINSSKKICTIEKKTNEHGKIQNNGNVFFITKETLDLFESQTAEEFINNLKQSLIEIRKKWNKTQHMYEIQTISYIIDSIENCIEISEKQVMSEVKTIEIKEIKNKNMPYKTKKLLEFIRKSISKITTPYFTSKNIYFSMQVRVGEFFVLSEGIDGNSKLYINPITFNFERTGIETISAISCCLAKGIVTSNSSRPINSLARNLNRELCWENDGHEENGENETKTENSNSMTFLAAVSANTNLIAEYIIRTLAVNENSQENPFDISCDIPSLLELT